MRTGAWVAPLRRACGAPAGRLPSDGLTRSPVRSEVAGVHCPFCRHDGSRVVDSRTAEDGTSIRRRRECQQCGRASPLWRPPACRSESAPASSSPSAGTKSWSGSGAPVRGVPFPTTSSRFWRTRLRRPFAQEVRHSSIPTTSGWRSWALCVSLDQIAYLRFASVYSSFDSLEDFEKAIAGLRNAEAAS